MLKKEKWGCELARGFQQIVNVKNYKMLGKDVYHSLLGEVSVYHDI